MNPGISFIVPTFNEEQHIEQCLISITKQMLKADIPTELIVVDNNSSDNTINIARKFTSNIFFNNIKGNPAITRNVGASKAQYNILCFIDGDCIIASDWITRLITTFSNEKIGAYGGPILSPAQGNWVEKAWAPTECTSFIRKNVALAGANFSIKRNVFESLNGFNESLISAEDDDMSKRVIASGLTISYDSAQSVVHLGYPKSLAGIFKKQIWHGSSQIRAHGLLGDKIVILTILFLSALGCFLLSLAFLSTKLVFLSSFILIIVPVILVYGRSQKFPTKSPALYIKMYFISIAFLCGRSLGLIKEISQKLIRI